MKAISPPLRCGMLLSILSAAMLVGSGCGGKKAAAYDDQVERAIGQVLGEQVAAAAPDGGKVVVLMQRGGGDVEDQRNRAYRDGLTAGLGSGAFSMEEAGPDLAEMKSEHQMIVVQAMTRGWPAVAYLGWCSVDPEAVAVISFIEFPSGLNPRSLAKMPPLFVFSTTGADTLRRLVDQGAVRYAIVPDRTEKPPPSAKASAHDVVISRYECLPE